jgi:hypothetical protein
MSKNSNVNPDHYKVAGRERQGEHVVHQLEKREVTRLKRQERTPRSTIAKPKTSNPETPKPAPPTEDAASRVGEQPLEDRRDRHTSHQAGSRSITQKESESRYADRSMPSSRKVAGAFGREQRRRTR